ncbi:hypothetical protein [Phytohabitans suffuscus]|uniref:Uncharacterized protein n=1 Tax=Phytohabitans suffuscus TaxID=624315 RepID=A0A6F8YEN3_9ACTN|nr:hypothetical protein [Phytohabitans suffuscus]BCB84438.1 hypothetical protein Psuf_017510 [Phytohabitans suffuscus]
MEHIPLPKGEIESYLKRRPQYEFVERQAGELVCGEVVKEPNLGLARVSAVEHPAPSFVQVRWSDDHGPGAAAARYPIDQPLCVRAPGPADRLRIQRAVDRAGWIGAAISASTARLIAVHLHRGPTSLLYDFAIDGAVSDALLSELRRIGTEQPDVRRWAAALAWYCRTREDHGPILSWIANARTDSRPEPVDRRIVRQHPPATTAGILTTKHIQTGTAIQLMDAAFALGLAAGVSSVKTRRMRNLIRKHTQRHRSQIGL